MAKSLNLYTRGLRQRLGGAVWYQKKGETLVRELAAHVSNPQTQSQMTQRVKLANLVAFYRANKAWMERYAFESKKPNWSVYNAFVSANLTKNPVFLTKEESQSGTAIVAPYEVTRGSLPSIGLTWDEENDVFYSDLYMGELSIPAGDTTTTVAQLTAALIANNNGIREGDQLSCIQNIQRTSATGVPFITVRAVELILDSADTTPVAERIGGPFLMTGEYGSTRLCVPAEGSVVGCILCLSRSNGSQIQVSTQTMVMTSLEVIGNYTGSESKRRSIRSYAGSVEEPFLTPTYQDTTAFIDTDISVLTVNGVGAQGSLLFAEGSNNLTIVLSRPVEDLINASVVAVDQVIDGSLTVITASNVSLSADRTTINATVEAPGSGYVKSVSVDFSNGIGIRFNPTIPEGGDITE